MFTEITYEVDDQVGVVTIDRPAARNALTYTTYRELEEVVDSADVGCLVITGRDPAFCSGDDVKQILASAGERTKTGNDVARGLTPAARALLTTDIPIIAAVNGAAVGWGMELALMADLRIASDRARFGELFVKRGLCCDVAGLGRLTQLVGRERASELLYTGRIIDAAESHDIGLVSQVVPHDEMLNVATDVARTIAANPPLAVQALKRGLREALDPDWEELGDWVSSSLNALFRTEDHREGVAAFLEKRTPSYVGR